MESRFCLFVTNFVTYSAPGSTFLLEGLVIT